MPWPTRLAGGVGVVVLALGGLALLGWLADLRLLRSVEADWPPMSPATALGLIIAGLSLRCAATLGVPGNRRKMDWCRVIAKGGSGLVLAVGGLHLGTLAAGHEVSVDWLSRWSWGRSPEMTQMSPMSALDFILFGAAVWLAVRKKFLTVQQTLGLATYLTGCLGLCRYAFAGTPLWATTNMALLSAVSFTALGLGVMCVRPDAGVGSLLAASGSGARYLRRYLPAALIAPFVVAGLLIYVKEPGRVGAGTSLAILAAISAALSFSFVWLLATQQERETRAQARLAAIINSSDDAIIGKTLDGLISSWNAGAERVFGYSAAEAVGQSIAMLIPPERADEEPAILARINRGEHVDHFQTERIRKDGKRIQISATISPVRDTTGRIIGASKIARDITALKAAELALRESETRFAVMFNKASLPAVLARFPDFEFVDANEAWLRLFGYTKPELVGRTSAELGLYHEPAGREKLIAEILQCRSLRDHEVSLQTRSGQEVVISINLEVLQIAGGEFALTTAQDITARRRAEAALRFSESVVRDAGRMAHVGGWHFNPLTGVGFWTEEVARIHDVPPEAPSSMAQGLEFYVGESRGRIEAAVKAAIEHGQSYDLELEFVSATGRHKWIRTIGESVVENGRVVLVRGAFQDITERRQAEEVRARMAEIVQGMTEVCFALDAAWRFTFVNERGEALLRRPRADIIGRSFWEVFGHLAGSPIEDRCRQTMQTRKGESFEVLSPTESRWFDLRLFPSGDGMAAFLLDIQARKEAEASLRLFRALMDQTEEGIEVVDPETARIIDINEAACRQLGYTREEAHGVRRGSPH
jgi:PAS domain S-box-containing protein